MLGGGVCLALRTDVAYVLTMNFSRITVDPAVYTGKPCIRDFRFPVVRLFGLLATGETREAILRNYPYLEAADIDAALAAAGAVTRPGWRMPIWLR